ncbi:MAG: hypothetical protein EBR02_05685 [Alphaproteobacteria bacterium]|nr:hypothetical protein [Alphaproteobacteria bacterium]
MGTALAVALPAFAQEHGNMQQCMAGMDCPHMQNGQPMMMPGMDHGSHQVLAAKNTVKLGLIPAAPLEAGKTVQITARLSTTKDGKPVTFKGLKEVHTRKLHLLIVDPSLSDYHHIHPVAGKKAGEYVFDFTPQKNDSYRVWADILPVATGKQEYVQSDMGTPAKDKAAIDKSTNMVSTIDGYTFTLALDNEPKAGEAVMGNITVTKDGKPFSQLQPVMGAFAHVVGFGENYHSIMHIHPMGTEPTRETEHGGPKLEFHIEPKSAGFVKLFAQVRIDGKDIFAPFGVMVK